MNTSARLQVPKLYTQTFHICTKTVWLPDDVAHDILYENSAMDANGAIDYSAIHRKPSVVVVVGVVSFHCDRSGLLWCIDCLRNRSAELPPLRLSDDNVNDNDDTNDDELVARGALIMILKPMNDDAALMMPLRSTSFLRERTHTHTHWNNCKTYVGLGAP